jgi:hypothetical protein
MKPLHPISATLAVTAGLFAADPAWPEPTPVNQVFQFQSSGSYITAIRGETRRAMCYLWIPETTKRVRGLLVLGANVPEHRLVGHELIRRMCAANDLAILWSTPSFLHPVDWTKPFPSVAEMKPEREAMVRFFQQQLEALARASGYDEVATVPWLPIGESTHLFLVDALLETRPERCIAGIYVKNTRIPPTNRRTPVLVIHATAQEWDQEKTDIRSKWNDVSRFYEARLAERKQNPGWPRSLIIDGHSGHFDCSDRLVAYMAGYIEQAVRLRCSADGSPALRPVEIAAGFVADLPVPGHGGSSIAPATTDDPRPWFFDRTAALEAQQIASIDWKAESQLPILLDERGRAIPNDFRGITKLTSVPFEADGLTFQLRAGLADTIPPGFVNAGAKLARAPGAPVIEWLIGPLEPLGGSRFRISLDRTWLGGGTTCVAIRQPGAAGIRDVVHPVYIDLKALRNTAGKPQTISFAPIGDVPRGTDRVPLRATSDAGLPVSFFVVAGPAVVRENTLVFTRIPPRSQGPVDVTVAAWQWGRREHPAVQMAEIVRQTFRLTAPASQPQGVLERKVN